MGGWAAGGPTAPAAPSPLSSKALGPSMGSPPTSATVCTTPRAGARPPTASGCARRGGCRSAPPGPCTGWPRGSRSAARTGPPPTPSTAAPATCGPWTPPGQVRGQEPWGGGGAGDPGRARAEPPALPPARYAPEKANALAFPSAPEFSLASRTRQLSIQQTPGPAAYRLPPMLGPRVVNKSSAPNYSIPGRSTHGAFYEDLCKTPGPCGYRVVSADVYKRRAPHYSMLARTALPGDNTQKPGPASYSPEQRRPEGLTFGIRHSDYVAPLIVDVPE
ncbi:ciliary microtubule associated protein 1B isoform X3 [Patagioenas fasciata]|uniref:ciliary microtubule associated protein 1B isoform X3 n=1 Tax=Patagioenas fasciata TaxID=372321 RepID=UPI003A99DDCF